MTEIKIEKKKQSWVWLVAIFFIAAILIYFLMFRDDDIINTTEVVTEEVYISGTNDTNLLGVKENNSTVAAFVDFIEKDTSNVNFNYDYTKEAFLKLTSATNAMAEEIDYNIQADLEILKESVELANNEPFETSLAKNIRNATDNSATALQHMQLARYPWLTEEVDELKNASTAIQPEVLTIKQKDTIINYFAVASDLLHKMN
ncbi:MAG TPA: hypothetical protein DER09_08225 [Prolixibacteraceae bacterium]|nr:hypothetical protein [Prolixibacteraceae bacterium]